MKIKKYAITDLLLFVVGTELVGALSGLLAGSNMGEYYRSLEQPPFAPPGWVFQVVWGILYAVMGISAYLIYHAADSRKRGAFIAYGVQLGLNFLWSIAFFRYESPAAAAVIISLLLAAILVMLVLFRRIRKAAALLNLPYLLWVAFAAYLNFGVLMLN